MMIAIGVPCGSFWFPFDVPVKPFHFLLLPCVGSEFPSPPQQGQKIIYRWHKGQHAPMKIIDGTKETNLMPIDCLLTPFDFLLFIPIGLLVVPFGFLLVPFEFLWMPFVSLSSQT